MIDHSCPVIVLDDVKEELWPIVHGLGVCGLPIISHWINNGRLERKPAKPYEGVRILFTDLHILGPINKNPEQYVSALVGLIQQLIGPSTYLVVFWSGFPEDSKATWDLLVSRLRTAKAENLIPFAYAVFDKTDVMHISDQDPNVAAQATLNVQNSIKDLFTLYPQLSSLMQWESCASRAASATSNELIGKLKKGGIPFTDGGAVKVTLKRMAQESLGYPHAPNEPTKGVYQALMPIAQDWMYKEAGDGALDGFLDLTETEKISLPQQEQGKPLLASLLNDFFIHSERKDLKSSERGVVIRLAENFLGDMENGLVREIGLAKAKGDWREAICVEFAHGFTKASQDDRDFFKSKLTSKNVYVVELSADCDYAQDKTRSQRFLLSLFVPTSDPKPFFQMKKGANESIYLTPEITLEGEPGRLLISCRIFLARAHRGAVEGDAVTRMRQEVLSEISHHYTTHMRRPGKIAFF